MLNLLQDSSYNMLGTFQPEIILLMIGTNDIGLQVPPDVLLRNLRAIVTRLREASITPVAQSILFRGGWLQADNAVIAKACGFSI